MIFRAGVKAQGESAKESGANAGWGYSPGASIADAAASVLSINGGAADGGNVAGVNNKCLVAAGDRAAEG